MSLFRAVRPADFAAAPFTYPEIGATRGDRLPAGYTTSERLVVVGSDPAALDRAAAAVFDWRAQRSVGLRVQADGPASEPGTVVVLTAGLPWLATTFLAGWSGPSRPVRSEGSPTARLPGHPESGEESFVVRLTPQGQVVFILRVFYRLASLLARAGGPASRLLQQLASMRYLTAIRRSARG